jgi:pyruvate,water dikinase
MAKRNTLFIRPFDEIGIRDVSLVGGKNASLGEMVSQLKREGIRVPNGFATTAEAYREFLRYNHLEEKIRSLLKQLKSNVASLAKVGGAIRQAILSSEMPPALLSQLEDAYEILSKHYRMREADVAVRSSATAEDLPGASFAGQQETYLNVHGKRALKQACLKCFASLFTDRAISYREAKGFDHLKVALSIGIQKMVRADQACSGVLFTLDTENGFPHVIVINGAWGLGENVVQGAVIPDEYVVFKPLLGKIGISPIIGRELGTKAKKMIYAGSQQHAVKNVKTSFQEQAHFTLNDSEVLQLAKWGCAIEKHYGCPMDIEWAKDGKTGKIFIVQARPETVQSQKKRDRFQVYSLKEKGKVLCRGLAIGEAIVAAKAQVIRKVSDIEKFKPGNILITEMTSPDWVPIMQRAAAIVTDHGGRTSHAAIVSRELGVPAIVGTNSATRQVIDGSPITVCCAEGEHGAVYKGQLDYAVEEVALDRLPRLPVKIMMNIASPDAAFRWWRLPCQGIGLARMEFMINNVIKIHPMALVRFRKLSDRKAKQEIARLTKGYRNKCDYFIDQLAQGMGKIAASRYPDPVIVRLSDFKTNEYANLIGGREFEPDEENPMLGFRGASRYDSPRYREGFALECRAIKKVREEMGLDNVVVMVPFCRTIEEGDRVLRAMEKNGLKRGRKGLEVYVMAEIPSNVILASEFAKRFDGFSIGSNDLTQLVLGVDRDSEELAPLFDERNPAVTAMIRELIQKAHKKKRKVGICGQAPSDHPDFAAFLVDAEIDSISLNPDSIVGTIVKLSRR